jgi:hypothetical protein
MRPLSALEIARMTAGRSLILCSISKAANFRHVQVEKHYLRVILVSRPEDCPAPKKVSYPAASESFVDSIGHYLRGFVHRSTGFSRFCRRRSSFGPFPGRYTCALSHPLLWTRHLSWLRSHTLYRLGDRGKVLALDPPQFYSPFFNECDTE